MSESGTVARCAVVGAGNIGSDLIAKICRSPFLEIAAAVSIDPTSPGLARARKFGAWTTASGVPDLISNGPDIDIIFDSSSANAHLENADQLRAHASLVIDLTPAASAPAVVPFVNFNEHQEAGEVSLITCGAQATIPIVAAVSAVTPVPYAEIVSTIASRSAGPGTRQNIDEFTHATAQGIENIGGAQTGKAIIILSPVTPPIMMRNTIYCELGRSYDHDAVVASLRRMEKLVAGAVPGYRLLGDPILDPDRITVFLEVEGAGDFLPVYAGNLDIMTAAAVAIAEAQVKSLEIPRA